MEHEIKVGTVLIRDNTLLPEGLRLEAGPDVTGWKGIKNFDGNGLDRAIQKTGWPFFCLAGECKSDRFRHRQPKHATQGNRANPSWREIEWF